MGVNPISQLQVGVYWNRPTHTSLYNKSLNTKGGGMFSYIERGRHLLYSSDIMSPLLGWYSICKIFYKLLKILMI